MQKLIAKNDANNKENANKCLCPCNDKPTFSRRSDRPPLVGIQDSNHAANSALPRCQSTSSYSKIPSPIIKPILNGKSSREFPEAIATAPPTIKLPPKITVSSIKSLNSEINLKPKPLVTVTRRKTQNFAKSKFTTETEADDVFLPPTTKQSVSSLLNLDHPSRSRSESAKRARKSTLGSYIIDITHLFSEVAAPTSTPTPDFDKMVGVTLKRDTSFVVDENCPWVDGENFLKVLDQEKITTVKTQPLFSPVKSNVPRKRSNSVTDAVVKKESCRIPAVKTTLLKRRSTTIKKEIYFPLLYSPDYCEGIINYLYNYKNMYILQKNWVNMFINKKIRTSILNWLLEISEHYFPQFETPYNMAVRLFDYSIVQLALNISRYQLVAIVAFWIAAKYLDGNLRLNKVSKLYALCSEKYSKNEILAMERSILQVINFYLNIPDPLDFLYNYLKLSNLENDEQVIQSAKFILECATLFESYSLITPSFLAASALYMATEVVHKETKVYVYFLWYQLEHIKDFTENVLKINVKYALMAQYEPVNKYVGIIHLFINI